MVEGSCRAPRIGDRDHLGRVVVPQRFRPPWGRAVKTGSASAVMCSFLAWTSLVVDVMVAKGLGDDGYRCALGFMLVQRLIILVIVICLGGVLSWSCTSFHCPMVVVVVFVPTSLLY
jgi:hypothetical protein